MSFWFSNSKNWKGPCYKKFKLREKPQLLSGKRVKPVITVKFVRQQKVFGKGGKNLVKKKTNLLLRKLRLYCSTGLIQNLPPISTLLSVYNINTQKFCEEISNFFKNYFYDSVPVIIK